jgi:serine/threonine protein kinase
MAIEQFGKYELIERLGSGGMAEVFLARTASIAGFEKLLAIKRLLPFCTQDQETVDLLADEARITVKLSHPNIVQVFDFGRVEDTYYIAMEYVDGLDLKSLVRVDELTSTPLRLDLALHLTNSILDALDFAHGRTDEHGVRLGIIHRDVSPHNVLLSRHGQIKLTDFGVARAAISIHVSRVGDIRGKFSYMPPEQVCGGEIDQRVDIFAAGAILYELLTGYQPYRSASANEQLQLLRHEVEPPSRYREDLPPELDAICLRALDKNPERRYASAGEFSAELRAQMLRFYGASLPPTGTLAELVEERLREREAERARETIGEESGLMSLADYSLSRESLIAPAAEEAQRVLRATLVDDDLDPRHRATVLGRATRHPELEVSAADRERDLAIGPADTEAFAPPLLGGETDELLASSQALPRAETGELEETVISFRPARAKTADAARLEHELARDERGPEARHRERGAEARARALDYLKTEASDPSFELSQEPAPGDRRSHRRPSPSDPTDRMAAFEDAPAAPHRAEAPLEPAPRREAPDDDATIASLRISSLGEETESGRGSANPPRRSFLPLVLVLVFSFVLGIIVAIVVATY